MPFDIEEWIKDNLEGIKRSTGNEFACDCPFCGKAKHFYINADSGNFICFKCEEVGRGIGGLAKLIAEVEGIKVSVARRMISKQQIHFKRREEGPKFLLERLANMRGREVEMISKLVNVTLPDEFIPVWKKERGWKMPLYLKQRGISKGTAKRWGLGYCEKGRYAGRIIFPISCPNGQSFTARDATENQSRHPKYLNPEAVDHGRLLYGWDTLAGGDVVLVEGPMDVLTLFQHGYEVLGLFGKSLHDEQMELLFRLPRDKMFIVMTDPEEVWAPFKIAKKLLSRFERVRIAHLPDVDPNEATREQVYWAYKQASRYRGDRLGALKMCAGKM